ncbi:S-adenosylmethionine decarboxylase [Catenovulum agarivorans DS-2]|uniref:S-adenosylmethionine decarboxylase proenzyme n=1 Tax=Catenovulum agarivorans DS-2 TaxID=1328313 RepID=W7QNA4_9ALTE|nr:adenosylmethionine decarboxylase [Catenovulum agarivorans]EWH09383.1 S-adenosylmethionine decarboxylase [Catenovulum agarivorans DS-2]
MDGTKKLNLHGFNNLTKSLSFSLYDISWAKSDTHRNDYLKYIDQQYNADRLTNILREVVEIIDANILNIARQDYEPQGASVTMLISERTQTIAAHLDKSHICVHTYPESHPHNGISTFRADIEVSTCGIISPLKALNFLIHSFDSDVVTLDYRVRGFTRDIRGAKHYIDHDISSIQNFVSEDVHNRYEMVDVNVYQENIFHTKMMLKELNIQRHVFGLGVGSLSQFEQNQAKQMLSKEIKEIFYGRNLD